MLLDPVNDILIMNKITIGRVELSVAIFSELMNLAIMREPELFKRLAIVDELRVGGERRISG